MVKGPEDSLIQTLHSDLFRQQAMTILKQLNISPAVESVSPTFGSRYDHSFYICRLCCKSITHIMNIGAMLHHLTLDVNMVGFVVSRQRGVESAECVLGSIG